MDKRDKQGSHYYLHKNMALKYSLIFFRFSMYPNC